MTTTKKILFITAPYHAGVVEVAGTWVPLYFVSLAGCCQKAGFQVRLYDAMGKGVGLSEISQRIIEECPDWVAVSTITSTVTDAMKVLEVAKQIDSSIATIAGGIHASFQYHDLLCQNPALDFVVVGEGEETLVDLLKTLDNNQDPSSVPGIAYRNKGNINRTAQRSFLTSLDNMPMAWDVLDWDDYTYYIIPGSRLGAVATSRGCEQACTFCSQQKFWQQKWRARSPLDVVNEITFLYDTYGVDVILFTDDYPTPNRERWEAILDLLIERQRPISLLMETRAADIVRDQDILEKYRQAGIIHIYIGTESSNQKRLDAIKKEQTEAESKKALDLCRAHGIITETSLITGFPDDTKHGISQAIDLLIDLNPDFAHFLALAPWPYADIYPDLEPFVEVFDFRKYNLIDPVIKPAKMSRLDVDSMMIEGYRRFYQKKFTEILALDPGFKKQYMMTAMKRVMKHSFIKEKLFSLHHDMPPEMAAIVEAPNEN